MNNFCKRTSCYFCQSYNKFRGKNPPLKIESFAWTLKMDFSFLEQVHYALELCLLIMAAFRRTVRFSHWIYSQQFGTYCRNLPRQATDSGEQYIFISNSCLTRLQPEYCHHVLIAIPQWPSRKDNLM